MYVEENKNNFPSFLLSFCILKLHSQYKLQKLLRGKLLQMFWSVQNKVMWSALRRWEYAHSGHKPSHFTTIWINKYNTCTFHIYQTVVHTGHEHQQTYRSNISKISRILDYLEIPFFKRQEISLGELETFGGCITNEECGRGEMVLIYSCYFTNSCPPEYYRYWNITGTGILQVLEYYRYWNITCTEMMNKLTSLCFNFPSEQSNKMSCYKLTVH